MSKYTKSYKIFFLFIFWLTSAFCLFSQENTAVQENNILSTILEDYISNNEDAVIDPTFLYDQLNDLKLNPININGATLEDWESLFFLEPPLIKTIMQYQKTYGPVLSIYELQAIPGLSIVEVRKILPFVKVASTNLSSYIPLLTMLSRSKRDLYIKCERIVEDQEGYSNERKLSGNSYYLGDQSRFYVRYKQQYTNKFSLGFIAEKDPGEEFFTGSNKYGFDYYSFHAFVRNYNKTFSAVALGDFAVSFGQGLILNSGFGYGKSAYATLIKRGGPVLLPYSSTLENNFFRGGGATIRLNHSIELTAFGSYKYVDANLVGTDSIVEYDFGFSSLQTSGLHRTTSEISDKQSIKEINTGGSIKYKFDNGTLSFNTLYSSFDKSFNKELRIDNQFAFTGKSLLNLSIDYTYIYRNIYFFGEFAKADQPSIASVNGALITLDKHIDLAILYRYLPKDYHALNANAFAEGSEPANENGLYLGTQIYPNKSWTINAYFDIWKNPWLKYTLSKPGSGSEYLIKVQYSVKKKMDVYVQYRNESKEMNVSGESVLQYSGLQNRQNFRIHLSNKLSNRLELRYRAEWAWYKGPDGKNSRGFMIYQDAIYKPIGFPVSFTSRIAFFDTKDYNSRIYAYENDLLYSFSIPPYYFKGIRWYLNIRSKITSNVLFEAGIAQTVYTNQDKISSGLEQINGNHKTEIKAQLKMSF